MARNPSNTVVLATPERGVDGRTVFTLARQPTMADGRIGDFCIDTVTKKLYGPKNAAGWPDQGLIKGDEGWTPVLGVVADGSRRVQRVVDWFGGAGAKPDTGAYIGPTGYVTDIAEATDYRGAEGPQALIDALDAASVEVEDSSLIATAEAGSDNEKRTVAEIFDVGAVLDRRSIDHAKVSVVRKQVDRIRTVTDAAFNVFGTYRRTAQEPSHTAKFRSADRWTAAGNSDSANGGWWELADREVVPEHFFLAIDADWTNAINRALNFGADRVRLRNGRTYDISGRVAVPPKVSFVGGEKTWLRCTSPSAGVDFLYPGVDIYGTRYGVHEHIHIDGNGIANLGLYIGLSVYAEFRQFEVKGCVVGWILDGAQNNVFQGFDIHSNRQAHKQLNGAGNNLYLRCEFSDCGLPIAAGEATHLSIETDPAFPGYDVNIYLRRCTNNTFLRCIFERTTSGLTSEPLRVRLKNSRQIAFRDCDFGSMLSLGMQIDSTAILTLIDGCYLEGNPADSTSYAILNAGFKTEIRGGHIQRFGSSDVIRTSSVLLFDGIAFENATDYIRNTAGSSRSNLRKGNAADHMGTGTTMLAAGLMYPGVFYFNDANQVFMRGNAATLRVVTADMVEASVDHSAGAAGDRLLTAQLTSGIWEVYASVTNLDNNHSRSAKFLVHLNTAGSTKLANVQKVGSDAAHGTVYTAISASIDSTGAVTLAVTTSSTSAQAGMRLKAVRMGGFLSP
jgi:hypothetical protein